VDSHGESDDTVEALELEVGEAPARPGAGVGDVEVVPPRRGGEPGGAVLGHEAPEGGRRRVESPRVGHRKWRTGRRLGESYRMIYLLPLSLSWSNGRVAACSFSLLHLGCVHLTKSR
jgi:hypothetical protein